MMPEKPADMMRRTMFNLDFVEHRKTDHGPFEVTQLVNSFLGALAHPWEKNKQWFNAMSMAKAHEMGWPVLQKERSSDQDPENFGDQIAWIRHAFAHGNVTYYPGQKGDIQSVHFYNKKGGRRIWGTVLTVKELQACLRCFVDLAEPSA